MDTISIRIDGIDKFTISDHVVFVPEFSRRSFSDLSQKERIFARDRKLPYLRHFRLHAGKNNLIYIPKVEIYESADSTLGTVNYEVIITTSLPKLLFENSLQEISIADKYKVFKVFIEKLRSIGIETNTWVIAEAPVSVVHFCKNIILPSELSFCGIISELSKVDIGKAYDTTEDTRRKDKNSNEILHLYCQSREWSFYDKSEDVRRSSRQRVDKQTTTYEKDLINIYALENVEIFRWEYRLKKAQTIRSEINTILGRPYKTIVRFKDLFEEDLWKKVLINSWRRIIGRPENQLAFMSSSNRFELMLHIHRKACEEGAGAYSQNRAFDSYGLASEIMDFGAKAVHRELSKIWSGKADDRLDKKLKTAVALLKDIPISQGISYIGREIEKFDIIKLDSLPRRV